MSYLKNTAGQKFNVLAINTATGLPVTGDATNITAQISLDSGSFAAVADTNPTELDATNAPGVYVFDLSQAETNGDVLTIVPSSTTANVQLDMLNIYTTDLQVLEDTIWDANYGDHTNVGSTGRSVGNIATVQNSIDVVDANVDAILVDTGTTIPAQISALNDFDPVTDVVANVTLVDTVTTNTDMRGTDGANTITPAIGGGSVEFTLTVTDGSNPIEGVSVWIATDAAGSNVVAGQSSTNSFGEVTFNLDPGTYYQWNQLGGYTFNNPTTITVS